MTPLSSNGPGKSPSRVINIRAATRRSCGTCDVLSDRFLTNAITYLENQIQWCCLLTDLCKEIDLVVVTRSS
ncbi:MAG: hypothetical protein BWY83_00666 [bacterium ADurb.Bin478]|nr:MAG: hypothetical protein BWY83_00666 [bacterium ADurb.Bin478]